jgi:hypothetical protein
MKGGNMAHTTSTPQSGSFRDKAKRAWKVAEAHYGLIKGKDRLLHRDALNLIKARFGVEFLYQNRHGNPAISSGVLGIFVLFTGDKVVWARHGGYWRPRQASGPEGLADGAVLRTRYFARTTVRELRNTPRPLTQAWMQKPACHEAGNDVASDWIQI